jgi:hypothetical protein
MIIQGISLINTSVYDGSFNSNGALLYIDIGNTASYSGSGTSFTDLSNNANTGTSAGSPSYTNGYSGYLSFNGAGNQYITTATAKYNKTYTGKTVIIAARLTSITATTFRCLFGCASGTRNFNTYIYSPSSGVYQIHYSTAGGGGFSNNLPLVLNQWFVLAVTQDVTGLTTYYFNGQPVGTTTGNTLTQWSSNGNENIGVGDNYWYGDIGMCAVYGRALSSDEIKQNYNSLDGRYGVSQLLVTTGLTYHLDIGVTASYSGSGSTVNDLSGSGLGSSTLYNTPTYTGGYLTFNGSSQYLLTSNLVSKFNSPSNTTLTLETWVYAASDNGVVVDELGQTAISPATGWRDPNIEIVSGSAKMSVWAGGVQTTTAGTFLRNQWNHLALTYDGTTLRTYINGVAGSTSTIARQAPWIYAAAGSTNLYYGLFNADSTNMGDGSYLAGNLGQFRVYTRALSAAEVTQNYTASKSRYRL